MNLEEFLAVVNDSRHKQDELLRVKGADYTRQDEDRLSNFKRAAIAVGLSPLQVWAVYAGKHIDAIMTYVKTGRVESEHIESRFNDLINYCYLGLALIKEETDKLEREEETGVIRKNEVGHAAVRQGVSAEDVQP